jgi:hypothetical protein
MWNHRILIHEHDTGDVLQIHEVYYDDKGNPQAYTENGVSVSGDDLKDIRWTLDKMKECINLN